jgi:hypothetical protein
MTGPLREVLAECGYPDAEVEAVLATGAAVALATGGN